VIEAVLTQAARERAARDLHLSWCQHGVLCTRDDCEPGAYDYAKVDVVLNAVRAEWDSAIPLPHNPEALKALLRCPHTEAYEYEGWWRCVACDTDLTSSSSFEVLVDPERRR